MSQSLREGIDQLKRMERSKMNRGFSIIQVTIGLGLLLMGALGVSQVFNTGLKSAKQVEFSGDASNLLAEMNWLLSDPARCRASLAGKNARSTPTGTITSLVHLPPSGGPIQRFPVTAVDPNFLFGNARLVIQSYKLSDESPDADVAAGSTELFVTIKPKTGATKTTHLAELTRKVKLMATLDSANNIIECRSVGGSDAIWERSMINPSSIYYGGGNVGIGTSEPVSPLHVETSKDNGNRAAQVVVSSDSVGPTSWSGFTSLQAANTQQYSVFQGIRSRGTNTARTSVEADDILVGFWGNGYHGPDELGQYHKAGMTFIAERSFSSASTPTALLLSTTNVGSVSASEKMRITADGRVGVGTTNPLYGTHAVGRDNYGWLASSNSVAEAGNVITMGYEAGGSFSAPKYNSPNAGFINVGGTVSASDTLEFRIENATKLRIASNGTVAFRDPGVYQNTNLCYTTDSHGFISLVLCTSLRERKKEIRDLTFDFDRLMALRPVAFRWKHNNQEDVGLIAEEVAAAVPELAERDGEGKLLGVRYNVLGVYLLEAIRSLRKELSEVKEKQAEMEERLRKLESKLGS